MPERLTIADVLTGLFHVLSDRGYTSFVATGGRLDEAFAAACKRVLEGEKAVVAGFHIALDDFGTSDAFRTALFGAAGRRLIRFSREEIVLSGASLAGIDLGRLPGGPALYETFADAFLEAYQGATA